MSSGYVQSVEQLPGSGKMANKTLRFERRIVPAMEKRDVPDPASSFVQSTRADFDKRGKDIF
jgi:hypothetical protein